MTYDEAVHELEDLGMMPLGLPQLTSIKSALDKTHFIHTTHPNKNIIIAGTNGKGSTAATLSRLLLTANQRVGLYTSPHLITTRERIRVNDQDISEVEFTTAYLQLKNIIQEEELTHFEALTFIAAFIFFSGHTRPPIDWAIWEVGMGGLYDATNAIPHRYCAITRLGLDHQAILGETLQEIALQKFGVIGQNSLVVHSPMEPEVSLLKTEITARTDSRWIEAKAVQLKGLNSLSTPWGEAHLNLLGQRGAENTATALTLFEALRFEPSRFLHGLSEVRWPGRLSPFGANVFLCPAYVSGDHNPQGIDSLLQLLGEFSWNTLHLIVGIGQDKDSRLILEKLSTLPRMQLYLTETPFKPLPLEEYPRKFRSQAVKEEKNISHLIPFLSNRVIPEDLVLVTGSLYLVGQVLKNEMSRGN